MIVKKKYIIPLAELVDVEDDDDLLVPASPSKWGDAKESSIIDLGGNTINAPFESSGSNSSTSSSDEIFTKP